MSSPDPLRRAPRTAGVRSTSADVRVPRVLAVSSLVGVVLACAAAIPFATVEELAPGTTARPHAEARLACASCHGPRDADPRGAAAGGRDSFVERARAACVRCHQAGDHASTRAPHARLAANGALRCTTCHAGHGSEGITFSGAGTAVRFLGTATGESGTGGLVVPAATVALVPGAACAGCHDLSRASDPARACVAGGVDACFDEHQRGQIPDPKALSPAAGACSAQHRGPRYATWEAARVMLATMARPSAPARASRYASMVALVPFGGAGLAYLLLARHAKRRGPGGGSAKRSVTPTAVRLPLIDATTCLGCYACVDACPFDVLEIKNFVATVARPNECCGAVTCKEACPNGSLSLQDLTGAAAPGGGAGARARVPPLDETLESSLVPGVYVAGDLTGLPLIKNAIRQGMKAAAEVANARSTDRRDGSEPGLLDVAIVGAGPAGISAALEASVRGLSYVVLEQATVAASIQAFPRAKLVFDPPLDLPAEGELWMRESTKEELLAEWDRIVRRRALRIREWTRVTALERRGAHFTLAVTGEATGAEGGVVEARRVIVAIGRRGTPRRLDAPIAPGAESIVHYSMADARSFAGMRVVVVGLGDSAMEFVAALAKQPGTQVTVSYRGADFARGKARNIADVRALIERGRVTVRFGTEVARVDRGVVTLREAAAPRGRLPPLAVDAVLVAMGGIPAESFLRASGLV